MNKTNKLKLGIGVLLALAGIFTFAHPSRAATLTVPYTSQAPLGQWSDPRQSDGCEEASILMAIMWESGSTLSKEQARDEIVGMSNYEKFFHGFYQDTSAQDTADLMTQYYGYHNLRVVYNVTVQDIKAQLDNGSLIITPLNPRVLSTRLYNSFTTRHTVVVVGHDNGEIIFHDPMTGAYRRAPESIFERAMQNYYSGIHLTAKIRDSAMIVVEK